MAIRASPELEIDCRTFLGEMREDPLSRITVLKAQAPAVPASSVDGCPTAVLVKKSSQAVLTMIKQSVGILNPKP
jgi:hypothetical protein